MSSGGGLVQVDLAKGCEDLPGHIALAAADDLTPGLALREAPGHVVPGPGVIAQAHHHDAVQRVACPAVAATVGGGDGWSCPRRPRSERTRTALRRPTPSAAGQGCRRRPPAARRRCRCRPKQRDQSGSRLRGEPVQLGVEILDLGAQGLVALGQGAQRQFGCRGRVVIAPGRSRGAVPTSWVTDRSRSCWRRSAGAVTSSALTTLIAWVRAFMALARATRSTRSISTCPVPALGRTVASPACTARAAASASRGSDLPRRRRAARSGRLTATTT